MLLLESSELTTFTDNMWICLPSFISVGFEYMVFILKTFTFWNVISPLSSHDWEQKNIAYFVKGQL